MKILFATHDYPFPIRYGGQVYSGNVVNELSLLCERFSAVAFESDINNNKIVESGNARWTLVPLPHVSRASQLFSRIPSIASKNRSSDYWNAIRWEVATLRPNVVIIDYLAVGWIVPLLKQFLSDRRIEAKLVYMSHNVETLLRQQIAGNYNGNTAVRALAKLDARRAAALEELLCRLCDSVSVETMEDAASFKALYGVEDVIMAPPGYAGDIIKERVIDAQTPRSTCVLGGRLSTMKQIVLDELLDAASERIVSSGIQLHIVGPMSPAYHDLKVKNHPSTTFHGFVKEVGPLLANMRTGIVADHVGGGFKHRILTYVFHRIPLVALPEAMAGLPFESGRDYIPIGSYEELTETLERVVDDFELLNRLQNSAFEQCFKAFSWSRNMADVFNELAKRAGK